MLPCMRPQRRNENEINVGMVCQVHIPNVYLSWRGTALHSFYLQWSHHLPISIGKSYSCMRRAHTHPIHAIAHLFARPLAGVCAWALAVLFECLLATATASVWFCIAQFWCENQVNEMRWLTVFRANERRSVSTAGSVWTNIIAGDKTNGCEWGTADPCVAHRMPRNCNKLYLFVACGGWHCARCNGNSLCDRSTRPTNRQLIPMELMVIVCPVPPSKPDTCLTLLHLTLIFVRSSCHTHTHTILPSLFAVHLWDGANIEWQNLPSIVTEIRAECFEERSLLVTVASMHGGTMHHRRDDSASLAPSF